MCQSRLLGKNVIMPPKKNAPKYPKKNVTLSLVKNAGMYLKMLLKKFPNNNAMTSQDKYQEKFRK